MARQRSSTNQQDPDALRQHAVLTLAEAASVLRCSAEHARLMALRGELPGHFRLGRSHRVSSEPFFRWLATITVESAPAEPHPAHAERDVASAA